MRDDLRIANAQELITTCRLALREAAAEQDPVKRRRTIVRVARSLRTAAGYLDDEGRLTE